MKAVIVRYQVKESFAETNAANIRRVMDDMQAAGDPGIRYQAFRQDDGVSFVHFGMYADDDAVQRMTSIPSFKAFQSQLKASEPVQPPQAQWLDNVGTSYPLF